MILIRCFYNHFKFNKNIFFVSYEGLEYNKNHISVPYCTHIKCKPSEYKIPQKSNKKFTISYAGRERNEVNFFNNINVLNTNKTKSNFWISSNDKTLFNKIDELYLNSYFSLQPHGDRKTRKGFYHSLLLGCIPVVFENNYKTYEDIFGDIVKIEDVCVVLGGSNRTDYDSILEFEKNKIESKIENINKIKHLMLYHESDFSIIDFIINRVK